MTNYLAGTLLGALFFGSPYAGIGVLDTLLFAVLAFVCLKLLRTVLLRRAAKAAASARAEALVKARGPNPWGRPEKDGADRCAASAARLPGFDQAGFLRGAKLLFTRIQHS
ncbi:MAG: Tim44 domain-containing protein, partial [Deltaproteobacteria bacterium]|nr:Tim44 domain-containing protein [Deltaproteobacteria bacterium]